MDVWIIKPDNAGKWRWKRFAPNGKQVGASNQGYVNEADCIENAKRHGYLQGGIFNYKR